MTRPIWGWVVLSVCCLPLVSIIGCGGGNGPVNGTLVVAVDWPARPAVQSQMIPIASEAISVRLLREGSAEPVKTFLIVRPTPSVQVPDLPAGKLRLEAQAFPQADGSGVAQATGTASVDIVAGKSVSVSLSLNSAVDHATLDPAGPVRFSNKPIAFAASFLNAKGEVVLVAPSSIKWTSTADSVATVTQQGVATAKGLGIAKIGVQDTESGKAASADAAAVALLVFSATPSTSSGPSDIFIRTSDASTETQLTHNHGGYNAIYPALSPDGTRIAFAQFVADGFEGYQIYIMNIDGSDQHPLTKAREGSEQSPSWSPDGRWIAYEQQGTLMMVRIDGRNRHNLSGATFTGGTPDWSPDGLKFAFSMLRDTGDAAHDLATVIGVANRNGSGVRSLTTPTLSSVDNFPSWSPDSARVAFIRSAVPSGLRDVFINDGTSVHQVTNLGDVEGLGVNWASDNGIYFSRERNDHNIWRIAPDGTGLEVITTDTTVNVSPDYWTPVRPSS